MNSPRTTSGICGDDQKSCTNPKCFFCAILKETDTSIRRARISTCLKEMPLKESQEHVLILSGLWNIAMTHPDDPELPSLGVFGSMSKMILKGTRDSDWLLRDQNVYIPYYAAHIIGSYTMNKVEFAEKAVESGVIPSLMELLRGKISWVEQRVAVRALGHLASYDTTFDSVVVYESEIVKLAIELASTCLDTVYSNFVGVKDGRKRFKYQIDLLTRGAGGGIELENRKAEEWASQLQCWSIYLLNCFACKERSLEIICSHEFLEHLCGIWGGLLNHSSPAGVGLIRILCYSKTGRKLIAQSEKVTTNLCHLSRSSDDWQYVGIDCLILLLKDEETRYKVIEIATFFLADLVELTKLGNRNNVGETITKALLLDIRNTKLKIKNKQMLKMLQDLWDFQLRRKREKLIFSTEKVEEKKILVGLIKQQGKHMFMLGEIEEAIKKYSEALDVCPLRLRNERIILYGIRAECYLMLGDSDGAISDSTRGLCLSIPANSHSKSLWRRAQAYDMIGLAKESLMDCIMFLHCCIKSETSVKIPYAAARMISKQMDATWIFADAKLKASKLVDQDLDGDYEESQQYEEMMKPKSFRSPDLSTIMEEVVMERCKK
ncbi:ARM-repeat/Tetratricopeptide repeat (TPR)-like protein [Euphorbia peplus]|nr:ARM-repeat/Tetratricopeptide repeat (TPR)-like protein [Euphorbia peplus]